MAGYAAQLGLDPERIERRLKFLIDRVSWYLGVGEAAQARELTVRSGPALQLERACAATLARDVGLLSLLLGDVDWARMSLAAASRQWLELGLFAGFALAGFARPSWQAIAEDEFGLIGRYLETTGDDRFADFEEDGSQFVAPGLPFEAESRSSARQALSLVQAARGRHRLSGSAADRVAAVSERASARLLVSTSEMAGATGMPLRGYVKLFRSVDVMDVASEQRDQLFSIAVRRAMLIDDARADAVHWQMLQKPAELIDLDLMALAISGLEADADRAADLFSPWLERGPATALPFLLAQDLGRPAASALGEPELV